MENGFFSRTFVSAQAVSSSISQLYQQPPAGSFQIPHAQARNSDFQIVIAGSAVTGECHGWREGGRGRRHFDVTASTISRLSSPIATLLVLKLVRHGTEKNIAFSPEQF